MANGKMTMALMVLAAALASCGDGAASNGAVSANDPRPAVVAIAPEAAASPAAAPIRAVPPAPAENLGAVWDRFRTAVLNGDAETIRALSAPMVEQRGELDSTPVVKLTPAKVPAVLAQMAKAPSGGGEGTTAEALAADHSTPKADTPKFARVGDFEFTRTTAGWRLSAFYYEPGMG